MCRLFGFRSVLQSPVHRSLLRAKNALVVQSQRHRDGWGIAHYVGPFPHVIKSPQPAAQDPLFHRVGAVVASHAVVAHVRRATQGTQTPSNCHPFQHGPWVMAHNGNIPRFDQVRPRLMELVDAAVRPFILGDTDSEVLFALFLTRLRRGQDCGAPAASLPAAVTALQQACSCVADAVGEPFKDGGDDADKTFSLTCIVTDGRVMLGARAGKPLHVSTHKRRCPLADTCPQFQPNCLRPSKTGEAITHFMLSSEPLSNHGEGGNVWHPLQLGQLVAVDGDMRLYVHRLDGA